MLKQKWVTWMLYPDISWAYIYCFLEAIVFNVYHSHMEEGKIIWRSPNTSISDFFVNVICVFWKDICFWSICRLFNLVFTWNMHWKNLFGSIFFGHPYCSNGTKIHLDAAMLNKLIVLSTINSSSYSSALFKKVIIL